MAAAGSAAELMDRIYGPQRRIYDLTRKYYLLGRDQLICRLQPQPDDQVLEIGCGTGRNLIAAARRHPGAFFFGIDISSEMLAVAHGAIARSALGGRVRVARADATTFDAKALFGQAAFDRIFISYSLSMIPAWPDVLERSVSVLAPGGALHIVDFGDQSGLPRWFRPVLRRWLACFHVVPRDQLEAALARLAADRGATLTIERPYRGYAQYAVVRLPHDGPAVPAAPLPTSRPASVL